MKPTCPICGGPMRIRMALRGGNHGKEFWGCAAYPSCRGTININPMSNTHIDNNVEVECVACGRLITLSGLLTVEENVMCASCSAEAEDEEQANRELKEVLYDPKEGEGKEYE